MVGAIHHDNSNLIAPDAAKVVYLLDVTGDYEESLLVDWIKAESGRAPRTMRLRSSRSGRKTNRDSLDALTDEPDTYLIPLRVLWFPKERSGTRTVRWSDLLRLGDPRDPSRLRARLIGTFRKSRITTVAAPGSHTGDLIDDHRSADTLDSLDSYITRRAWRALDVEERRLRGNRYKTPRFVAEAISSRRQFRDDVVAVGAGEGISAGRAQRQALAYLDEIAAKTSPLALDLIANAIHHLYRRGYGAIRYDPEQVRVVAELGQEHPIVFLPSHRSNLDRLSLQYILWENDLPPNHTAGGINMNFFPVGPLLRRTGLFFIRRTFRDNLLYKTVLQHYLDYLIEKRFSLEWYLEGGRSRSGRLLPPRLGLLNYVIDAQRRGKANDIILIPVSIAYDQIQDIPDYAREARGTEKEKESLGWMVRSIQSMNRRYGDIHIRFGEPVSTRSWQGESSADQPTIDVQKLAFEVMYRIGRVTPVTPTSVVSVALLEAGGEARTESALAERCLLIERFVAARSIPTTGPLSVETPGRVAAVLERLVENGDVSTHRGLGRQVYWCDDEQKVRISYYRNMIVHFFLDRAIAEIVLGSLAGGGATTSDFFQEVFDLRDLLKFEFFFPEKDEFDDNIAGDLELDVPQWEEVLARSGPEQVLSRLEFKVAPWALLPFLDAYQVVGDELEALDGPFHEEEFLERSLERALMYRIEDGTISGESASRFLFKSALALADNRGLLTDDAGASERRAAFAGAIRDYRSVARSLS